MALLYVTRRIPEPAESMLRSAGHEVDVNPEDRILTKGELVSVLKRRDYEGMVSLLTDSIDAEVFDAAPRVRIVSNYAVGFNNIDVTEARKRGVTITNTPGSLTESVAEHTVALLLSLATRTVEGDRFVRAGAYRGWDPFLLLSRELRGQTVGILGAGRIGERVMEILVRGFSMTPLYYDVTRNERLEKEYGAEWQSTPEELLAAADVVSIHVPLTPATTHLIDERRLALMKKTALLINTSRGPVIDEKALADALEQGVIAGAGLDVFEREPRVEERLLALDRVVLTPHIASATEGARHEMAELAAKNIIAFFRGETPPHIVR